MHVFYDNESKVQDAEGEIKRVRVEQSLTKYWIFLRMRELIKQEQENVRVCVLRNIYIEKTKEIISYYEELYSFCEKSRKD